MDELQRIDVNQLVTLHALLTEKHVTRAAVRLHKSQPAVSHTLGQLRTYFGDPCWCGTAAAWPSRHAPRRWYSHSKTP